MYVPLNTITGWAEQRGEFPAMEELIEDRSANVVNFKNFAEKLLCIVAGKKKFKKERTIKTVSEICTGSDEAFLMVTLENSYKAWKAEFDKDENEKIPHKEFTNNPAASHKYGGWSAEGINRYNTYMEEVKREREKQERQDVEKEYLTALQEEQANGLAGGRKRKMVDMNANKIIKPIVYHQILDDGESNKEEEEEDDDDDDDDDDGVPKVSVQI